MPDDSGCFIYAPYPDTPRCSVDTVFFEVDSEYEARILSKMVGDEWGQRLAWISTDQFDTTELSQLRETIQHVRDGTLQKLRSRDCAPSLKVRDWERTTWAKATSALQAVLRPEGKTELPNDQWIEGEPFTDDEALAVFAKTFSIVASAYHEMLELVCTSEVVSLDNRLDLHYQRLLHELRDCFEALERLGVEMGEFQPMIPDLFPSTVLASDWEREVRPHAESLHKHAHRVAASQDLIELQSGSVAKLCVETVADVAFSATEHARMLRRGWDQWTEGDDSETPDDRSSSSDDEGRQSPNRVPTLQLGDRKAPWYIDQKPVKRPSVEQEAVIRALVNSPKHTLEWASLSAFAKVPHKKLANLKKHPGWKEIIQMSGKKKKGYRLRCVVSPSSVNPPKRPSRH